MTQDVYPQGCLQHQLQLETRKEVALAKLLLTAPFFSEGLMAK